MKALMNARFSEKEIVGLDHFRYLLEVAYYDPLVVEVVYEKKIYSLSACRDAAAAQSMLDYEIDLLQYFTDMLYGVRDLEISNDVFDTVDEMDDVEFLEQMIQKWKVRLLQELRQELQQVRGTKI